MGAPASRICARAHPLPVRNMRNRTQRRDTRAGSTHSVTTASLHQTIRPPRFDRLYVSMVSLPPLSPKRGSKASPNSRNWCRSKSRLLVAAPRMTSPDSRRRGSNTPLALIHGSTGPAHSCCTGPATAAQSHASQERVSSRSQPAAGISSSSMKTSASASAASTSARLRAAEIPGSGS